MKANSFRLFLLSIPFFIALFCGCSDDPKNDSLPIVQTLEVTNITSNQATSGGMVTHDGGQPVTERGICWDINPQPTKDLQTKKVNGHGTGSFESHFDNLEPNQQYFVRAYATNSMGTSYGNEVSFFTEQGNTIVYKMSGSTVKYGDLDPIAIDLSDDGYVDFTIFVELTANSLGDRLYVGMNPVGVNGIKSGSAIDDNFLNMGFLVAQTEGSIIDAGLNTNERWTTDSGVLAIRNTFNNGSVSYEGAWGDGTHLVGVQHNRANSTYFGWMRIAFDKTTEVVTLIDYAYNTKANQHIRAGVTSN
ncbi:fibronectin type III domain-containing protein [Mariniflexile gromovii]|uniref:Fibronectin type III domain-containing protein n=1 Tax=Mariniflexile gromovii TaxID=362523 RepID=A0ABS4BXP3_9FLAO|nr:fibronectin type III domain-containing protein [Mariniflexile gromovii]MBP0905363.1 fibronectin type III domain-containing protein [Mariniflexile gromovii]